MVASLAAEYPPSRVGFLLVDYKGGAAFKDAMHLPHCVGVVTDLDEHLTRRVILALDAEIRRREELLADHGARDLTELRRIGPEHAPADLVIVVDEFATLAKEIPEFVEGVVDIAARGRSLGLRLVLATQRPAGVINDRIRANVGVRIALRVNDEADSTDVIGDREAAHIAAVLARARVPQGAPRPRRVPERVRRGHGPHRAPAPPSRLTSCGSADSAPVAQPGSGLTVLEAVVDSARKVMQLGRWAAAARPVAAGHAACRHRRDLADRSRRRTSARARCRSRSQTCPRSRRNEWWRSTSSSTAACSCSAPAAAARRPCCAPSRPD